MKVLVGKYKLKGIIKMCKHSNMELDTEFIFGKFRGRKLKEMIINEPLWVQWCVQNGVITITDEANDMLIECVEEFKIESV